MFPKDANKPEKQLSIAQLNLRRFRRAAEMTGHQLDDAVGVPRGRTASYESGRAEPTEEFLEAAVFPLGIKDAALFRKPLSTPIPGLPEPNGDSDPQDEPAMVPYWGVVPCGDWEAPTSDPDLVPVSSHLKGRSDIVGVKVTGESMMPLLKPGLILPIRLIKRKTEGAISLIRNEDAELSLKVARRMKDGSWEFHSINPLYGRITSPEIDLVGVVVHIPEMLDLDGVSL